MSYKIQASVVVTAAAISIVGFLLWRKKKNDKAFVKVGRVKKLLFFPLKSLKGIEVPQVQCTSRGIEIDGIRDRSYMLISGDGALLSQRQEPSMVLLTPSISGNEIHVTGPGLDTLKIDIKTTISPEDKLIDCQIFTDHSKGVDCGDEVAAWFQNYFKRSDVRLVRQSLELPNRKYLREDKFFKKAKQDHPVNFQDLAPFHLLSQASLDLLNTKLVHSMSVNNFRPNILVEDCAAFEEDNWEFIQFPSGAEFFHLLPCGRCLLTTNDPETGVKTNKEPLTTLRKFRMLKDSEKSRLVGHAPCFGVNCILEKPGSISVGDDIFAVVKKGLMKF